jgi:hypothetical protein
MESADCEELIPIDDGAGEGGARVWERRELPGRSGTRSTSSNTSARLPTRRSDNFPWAVGSAGSRSKGEASALGDGAANRECVAHAGVEVGVFRIRLDTKRVERLAEEASRGSSENDVGDLLVR